VTDPVFKVQTQPTNQSPSQTASLDHKTHHTENKKNTGKHRKTEGREKRRKGKEKQKHKRLNTTQGKQTTVVFLFCCKVSPPPSIPFSHLLPLHFLPSLNLFLSL
jgi:hypothetical protein